MQKQIVKDQLGRKVTFQFPPKRIISLVPSQTELLFELGLNEEIVGITKFCIHPKDKFKSTTKLGGTKKLNLETIKKLKPDLIIGNKEENEQSQIESLMQDFPVWMSDIYTLNDALEMIVGIGKVVDKEEKAISMASNIAQSFSDLNNELRNLNFKKAAYFIWKDPYMLAGNQTFINEMLSFCGLKNALNLDRYPTLTLAELSLLNPEIVLLSSEPYPFRAKHQKEFEAIWPHAKICVVDGEMFSWYGSRLLKSARYFGGLNKSVFLL